jgi:Rod binding domain-containing protein
MNIKRVIIVGTMIVVMSFGNSALGDSVANASPVAMWSFTDVSEKDDLLEALHQSSNEELYESLYAGKSLYDIAADQGGDIAKVIQLQLSQLTAQLDNRLRSGSISAEQYNAHKEELKEVVEQSVFTAMG